MNKLSEGAVNLVKLITVLPSISCLDHRELAVSLCVCTRREKEAVLLRAIQVIDRCFWSRMQPRLLPIV